MSVDSEFDVRFRGVTKRFGEVVAVDDLDLDIRKGEFLSLLGSSGCGKTTSLRMIAGFEQPSSGSILIGGEDAVGTPPYRRDVNTVFQHYALFPHMTVLDNVAYGLKQRGVEKGERLRKAQEALELVHLQGRERRKPRELSGGQQQRVALARALVMQPRVLLLDEPLGALDLKLRKDMQVELKRIQQEVGITFVYVTHDQGEAMSMSDRIAVMCDGRIEQLAAPEEIYDRPASEFVANFIGEMNMLRGQLRETANGHAVVDVPGGTVVARTDGTHAAGDVTVGIRPERIRLAGVGDDARGANSVEATVITRMQLGSAIQIVADAGDGAELTALVPRAGTDADADHLAPGDRIRLAWPETAPILLAA
ncbi:ABC transporter ATP-binding protein [Patulibacter sp. SYSU D01012]|uniref:ABC transporter ATP-binding protein n=1 Tax=Patulibacter sp. SYSU D01012 TaxID=2817381 RepID=UPI001B301609|nr:ABC transporter ATP-binding protein [Patulibacter sp. SYSU D01012]